MSTQLKKQAVAELLSFGILRRFLWNEAKREFTMKVSKEQGTRIVESYLMSIEIEQGTGAVLVRCFGGDMAGQWWIAQISSNAIAVPTNTLVWMSDSLRLATAGEIAQAMGKEAKKGAPKK